MQGYLFAHLQLYGHSITISKKSGFGCSIIYSSPVGFLNNIIWYWPKLPHLPSDCLSVDIIGLFHQMDNLQYIVGITMTLVLLSFRLCIQGLHVLKSFMVFYYIFISFYYNHILVHLHQSQPKKWPPWQNSSLPYNKSRCSSYKGFLCHVMYENKKMY